MRLRLLLAIVFVATQLAGQTQSAACPADQPVDDLLATVHKLHSKRANRNKSLLTDSFCIGGWCLAARDRPKTSPEEIQVTPPSVNPDTDAKTRVQIRQCEDALNDALHAAHNVEVGDQQIEHQLQRLNNQRARLAADSQAPSFRFWSFTVKGLATAAVLVVFGVGAVIVWQRAVHEKQAPVVA